MHRGSGLPPIDVPLFLEKLGDPSRALLELDGVKVRVLHHAFVVGRLRYGRARVLLTESALYVVLGPYTLDAVTWTGAAIRWTFLWTLREIRHDHETLWIGSRLSRHPTMRGYYRLRGPRVPELAAALAGLVPPELARR